MKKKIAVLHHNDADGFGAAYAAYKSLRATDEMIFISVQYGQEPPYTELVSFRPDEIHILDFSYSAEILLAMEQNHRCRILIIDHHKTAEENINEFLRLSIKGMGVFGLNHSGATLAWEFYHAGERIPQLLLYVEDRDLWRFELPNSKEVNAYTATLPQEFEAWDDFKMEDALVCGAAILSFQKQQIERRLKDVVMVGVCEGPEGKYFVQDWDRPTQPFSLLYTVPFVNASDNISELGHAMNEAYPDSPFSVSYCDRPDGKRSYSLRSQNGFDVSEVAKAFGGGGHKAAAGFTLDAPDII